MLSNHVQSDRMAPEMRQKDVKHAHRAGSVRDFLSNRNKIEFFFGDAGGD